MRPYVVAVSHCGSRSSRLGLFEHGNVFEKATFFAHFLANCGGLTEKSTYAKVGH